MKILGIMAGPRRKGMTAQLFEEIIGETMRNGNEVETIHVHDLDLAPCRGCNSCRKQGTCVIKDDLAKVHSLLDAADALVVASPTYWGNMTSPLKCLFDRSVFRFESFESTIPRPLQKGKKAIIVTTCASPYPLSHSRKHGGGAVHSIEVVLKSAGFRVVGTMIRSAAEKSDSINEKDIAKARKMGRRLS
jgi:multimeric flavodoxin WrbA